MFSIWKFPIPVEREFKLEMPAGSKVLSVQDQVPGAGPCLWALVRPKEPSVWRRFILVGTGHPIRGEEALATEFVGTFQIPSHGLVFHLFQYREGV